MAKNRTVKYNYFDDDQEIEYDEKYLKEDLNDYYQTKRNVRKKVWGKRDGKKEKS